ncbi:MAG3720 family protein [Mycoplasmopsis glycophila]|uniref:Cell division protein FtsA n=1 Tax=Mycoplasmopsis glycophila TaxID=171285 RepID=A0A449AUW7_9BACT|nr:hypothetical protein [Mycoplasmopsis glycophila]VEU70307.1 Uncharacterised protein [Mycoplasmopsis glycophila]
MKHFLNFHLINSKKVKITLIKHELNKYYNGGLNFLVKLNSGKEQENAIHKIQNFLLVNKKEQENFDLQINVLFEDSIFKSLKTQNIVLNLKKADFHEESFRTSLLPNFFEIEFQKKIVQTIDRNYEFLHHPYMVTIKKDNVIKIYRDIPTNKEFDSILQHYFIYTFSKDEPVLKNINQFIELLNLKAKVNYLFKSQLLASYLTNTKKPILVVNIDKNYITLNVTRLGKVVDYQRLEVGTSSFIKAFLNSFNKLSKDEILSRLTYIHQTSEKDLADDLHLKQLKNGLDKLLSFLHYEINRRINEFNSKHNAKIITEIAFTGELAWLVNSLMDYFEIKSPQFNVSSIESKNDLFIQSEYNDKIINQLVYYGDKLMVDNDQVQTQTSEIEIGKASPKSFLHKLKEFLTLQKGE